ncbi:MAG: 50S ribosomal protein L11, partial [Firmicutes bacterium]|nr:50S ribosomal protein L11 [Bacillota bacterium]
SPPASDLLKKAANLAKGSGDPKKKKVGQVPRAKVMEIAELKKADLSSASMEAAVKMIEGTARSMGLEVVD